MVVVAVEVEGGPAFLVLVLPLAPGVLICGRREDGLSLSFGVCGRASAGSAARGRRMSDEREAGAGEDAGKTGTHCDRLDFDLAAAHGVLELLVVGGDDEGDGGRWW